MKRAVLIPILAASALALTACASMQPYGPAMGPSAQGYSEQRIESDYSAVISVANDRAMSMATARTYPVVRIVDPIIHPYKKWRN